MARPKVKKWHSFGIRMDEEIFLKLDAFSKDTGISKTAAIEKAVKQYIDNYNRTGKLGSDIQMLEE